MSSGIIQIDCNKILKVLFFQLHVPVQLPCYDFIQVSNLSMDLPKTNLQARLPSRM